MVLQNTVGIYCMTISHFMNIFMRPFDKKIYIMAMLLIDTKGLHTRKMIARVKLLVQWSFLSIVNLN